MNRERISSCQELDNLRDRLVRQRQEKKTIISVCAGTGCQACGCEAVLKALRTKIKESGLENVVEVKATGCPGPCEWGPLMTIHPEKIFYIKVSPQDVNLIIDQTIKSGKVVNKLLYKDPVTGENIVHEDDVPFFKKQTRLLIGNNNLIDSTSIHDYIILNGYKPMAKALTTMNPEDIIEEVKKSGLRGRGGAGFPTGTKWELARASSNEREQKYIVCNADEGDPGAYMDRSLLEGNPHAIIEGMVIAGTGIGATQGFIYVRGEYPLAIKNTLIAVGQARDLGLLGNHILGTDTDFDIQINRGAGAFVCGEETALIKSIEGLLGEPSERPPYPVEKGIWGHPTCINNVETLANIPVIISQGGEEYAKVGVPGNTGTKIFSLVGKIKNTGLVEVPMGIKISEIVNDIGGGPVGKAKIKAVQTGGPSGGCISASLFDLPIDYESLAEVGAIMGSGGMIVMDEDSCVVDVARYFLNFLQEESCGKCLPCREGIRYMLSILTRITEGQGRLEDLDLLQELSQVIIDTSLCQLGGTAPNPILSTIRYFHEEYVAHITDKRCPAGVCKALVSHAIDENCIGCHACFKPCPTDAIMGSPKQLYTIIQDKCIQCGACYQICRYNAIKRVKRGEGEIIQRRAQEVWKPKTKAKSATMA